MEVVTCPTCSTQFELVEYLYHAPSCCAAKCRELNIDPVCYCTKESLNHPTIHPITLSNHEQRLLEKTDYNNTASLINMLPSVMLSLILNDFQENEESFFVGLVCKKWNSIIKRNRRIHLGQVAENYAQYGNMSALDRLNKSTVKTTYHLMDDYCKYIYYGAAKSGNLSLFQHMRHQGYPFNRNACKIAAENGRLNIIEYIVKEIEIWEYNESGVHDTWIENVICPAAAKNGHLHILKAMPAKTSMNRAFNYALSNGQIEILNWITDNRSIQIDANGFDMELAAGNLDSLTWLTTEYKDIAWNWDAEVMYSAAKAGNIDVVKLLRTKNCEWDSSACSAAARNGHFAILQYLYENGCPLNVDTINNASEYGDLKVVQWLVENQCPYYLGIIIKSAVKGGNLELVKWIHSKLYASVDKSDLCTTAIAYEHWNVLRWLLDNNCKPDDNTMLAALDTQLDLKTLIEIYQFTEENDTAIIEKVAMNGRRDFIDWLSKTTDKNKEPKYFYLMWSCVIEGAMLGNHLDILKNAFVNCLYCTESLPMGMKKKPELHNWLFKQGCLIVK